MKTLQDYDAEFARLWAEWLALKPPAVRALAAKYPPGTRFQGHDGATLYAISYDEHQDGAVTLGVTAIDPAKDYAGAVAGKKPICSCCMAKLDTLLLP